MAGQGGNGKPNNKNLPGMTNPHMLPWLRQPGESWQAYEAFTAYRDIGKTRTHAKAADVLGKSVPLMHRWAAQWNWTLRAQQHDANEDHERMIMMREHRAKIIMEHAKEARDVRQQAVHKLLTSDPNTWSITQAIRALKVASELERLSVGASTANIAQSIDSGAKKIDQELQELEAILEDNPEAANAGAKLIAFKRERAARQRSDVR